MAGIGPLDAVARVVVTDGGGLVGAGLAHRHLPPVAFPPDKGVAEHGDSLVGRGVIDNLGGFTERPGAPVERGEQYRLVDAGVELSRIVGTHLVAVQNRVARPTSVSVGPSWHRAHGRTVQRPVCEIDAGCMSPLDRCRLVDGGP